MLQAHWFNVETVTGNNSAHANATVTCQCNLLAWARCESHWIEIRFDNIQVQRDSDLLLDTTWGTKSYRC